MYSCISDRPEVRTLIQHNGLYDRNFVPLIGLLSMVYTQISSLKGDRVLPKLSMVSKNFYLLYPPFLTLTKDPRLPSGLVVDCFFIPGDKRLVFLDLRWLLFLFELSPQKGSRKSVIVSVRLWN